jgi:hypothetical protein
MIDFAAPMPTESAMKPGDLGLTVTAVEILGIFVPGTLALWALVLLGAPALSAPEGTPPGLQSAAGVAAIVVLGALLKEAGHLLNPLYDGFYAPRFPALKTLSRSVRDHRKLGPDLSTYVRAMDDLRSAKVDMAPIELDEGMGKLFRALCIGLLILVPVLAARDAPRGAAAALAAALGAGGLSFHLRLKASMRLYRSWKAANAAAEAGSSSGP